MNKISAKEIADTLPGRYQLFLHACFDSYEGFIVL